MTPDAFVQNVREQISQNDRAIVDAINRRLELVAALKRYKEANGIPLLDPQREEWLVRDLQRANGGPLSGEGLERAVRELLDLAKRELF
jgi:chorismate mutase/prephenate dehydratase